MRRTSLAAFTLTFLAVPTAATAGGGCHEDGPSQPQRATQIRVEHACFGPIVAEVPLGGKLTWLNSSGMDHNITGPAMAFTELPDGATHAVTFDRAGIYVYACLIHPGMSGAVVVRDAAVPAAPAVPTAPAAPAAPAIGVAPVASVSTPDASGPSATGVAVAALATLGAGALVLGRRRQTANA